MCLSGPLFGTVTDKFITNQSSVQNFIALFNISTSKSKTQLRKSESQIDASCESYMYVLAVGGTINEAWCS